MVSITIAISGILAILAGLMVIIKPRWIRWAIGIYLILIGVVRLVDFTW